MDYKHRQRFVVQMAILISGGLLFGTFLRADAAGTTVYLPAPNTAIDTIAITTCTDATPIVCTAPSHGLSNGEAVWIEGITGNTNADGFFQVSNVTTNTFTLANELYYSLVPPGNGTYGGAGHGTPLVAYSLPAQPRGFFAGPTDPLLSSLSDTSDRATTSNPFFSHLQSTYNSFSSEYTTAGIDSYNSNGGTGTGMVRYADAGLYWVATGESNSTALTVAKWGIDHFEQIVDSPYGFYCDETQGQCGRDDTDVLLHPAESAAASFQDFSLIESQLTATETSNFADKLFNDNALIRNANSLSRGGGSGGIAGDPTTSCTPWPSGGVAWNQSLHYCGYFWFIKHEYDLTDIDPGQEGNFESDYPATDGLDFTGGWPYDGNHMITFQRSLLAGALALADDDARARSALTQLVAFYTKWEYPYQLSTWTGLDEEGSRYEQYIASHSDPQIVDMLKQSIPGYDLSGTWVQRYLPLEIYGVLPDGGTGTGYGGYPYTLDQWMDPTGSNSNGDINSWVLPTLSLTALMPSDPLTSNAYWMLTSNSQFATWNFDPESLFDDYINYEPHTSSTNVSALPSQYLFKDTSYATCEQIFGSTIAVHDFSAPGNPGTDTAGCYPNMAFEMAISKSDWTSDGTQVWMSAAFDDGSTDDRSGGGQWGAYHIYKDGYLLAGDGNGNSPDMATGSAHPDCGGDCDEIASDMVIEIGGGDNWQPQESTANVSANFDRWAGTDPSGDSQGRYAYALINMTQTYTSSTGVTRADRSIIHFKKSGAQDYVVSYDDVALSAGKEIQSWWHYFLTGTSGTNTVVVSTSSKTVSNTLSNGDAKLLTAFLPAAGASTSFALLDTGASNNTRKLYTCPSSNGTTCNNSATSGEWIAVQDPTATTSASMPALTQPAVSATGGNAVAVQIADATSPKVAVFARQGALLSAVSFTSTYSGTAQYLIAGLTPGSYNVTRNGSAVVSNQTVNTNDNTLYFETTAGNIEVDEASATSTPSIASFSASPAIVASAGTSTFSWSITNASSVAITPGSLSTSTLIGSFGVNPTSTTIYTLTATNSNGTSTATTTVTVDSSAPTTPTGLAATSTFSSQINLSWASSTDSGGSGLAGYDIFRCTGSCTPSVRIATSSGAAYSDTGLTASTTYTYSVSAYDGVGNTSATSTTATATTQASGGGGPNCGASNIRCVGSGQEYTTIQAAANAAVAGDEVYVFNGNYAGFHTVNAGTASSPIVYLAQSTSTVVDGNLGEGDSGNDTVEIDTTNYITFNGFTVQNAGRAGIRTATDQGVIIENNIVNSSTEWGIFTAFAPNVQLLYNTITNTSVQHGIYVSNSDVPNDDPVIIGNNVSGAAGAGIQINGDCETLDGNDYSDGVISGAIVEDNIVHGNDGKGFSLIDMQDSLVENNVVYGNGLTGGAAGIHLAEQDAPNCTGDESSNNIIANNTINEPNMAAIRITNGTGNVVFNNIAVSTYGTGSIIDETGGPNYIDSSSDIQQGTTGTLFVNASSSNYQLASGSAAVDAGRSTYQSFAAPGYDILGNVRPAGSADDIGAYERNASAPGGSAPLITGFSAVPSSTTSGSSSILYWNVSGATTTLSLDQGIGIVTGASYSVSPTSTTTYTLTAANGNGTSTATTTVTVSGAASKPTVNSFSASSSSITLGSSTVFSWNVSNASSVALSGNNVNLSTSTLAGTFTGTPTASGTLNYTLTATNSNGTSTAQTSITVSLLPDTTPPSVPTSVMISGTTTSTISLSWASSTDSVVASSVTSGLAGYEVFRCAGGSCSPTVQIATSSVPAYTNAGLATSTSYTYAITAFDNSGNISAKSSNASGTTQSGAKPTVSSFTASGTIVALAGTSTLSWSITNASSVAITPGSFSTSTLLASTTVNPTSTTIYTLTATNSNGTSTATTTVTVDSQSPTITSFAMPTSSVSTTVAVTSFVASDNHSVGGYLISESSSTPSSTNPNWVGSAPTSFVFGGAGSRIAYAFAKDEVGNISIAASTTVLVDLIAPTATLTSPANGATVSSTITVTATASDNVSVAGVQFLLDGSSLGAEDMSSPYQTSWNTQLVANGSYTVAALAYDEAGNHTTSTVATVTVSNTTSTPDTTPPSVPTGLTATSTASTITLAWTPSTDNLGVAGYQVFRCLGSSCNPVTDIATSTPASFTNTGLPTSTSYTYAVRAFDSALNLSSSSASVSATTKASSDTTPPSIPQSLAATAASQSEIDLTWSSSTDDMGVAGYDVYRNAIFIASTTNLSYADTGLAASTLYAYSVDAFDAALNTSAQSDSASATTQAASSGGGGGGGGGGSSGGGGGGGGGGYYAPPTTVSSSTSTQAELLAEIASLEAELQALLAEVNAKNSVDFTRNLTIGMSGDDVQALQKFLNAQGFTVRPSGPGSPGNESTYFGPATASALASYQKSQGIVPAVGYFGSVTRARVNAAGGIATSAPAPSPITTNSSPAPSFAPASVSPSLKTLSFGMTGPAVKTLQDTLVTDGYLSPGAAMPGTFDTPTLNAVETFQCFDNIACSSADPGYGIVGPKTQAGLAQQ